ncbi:MAG: membrane protein insertase YidC [Hyphomonas sp.]|uniref:membrane protein insertase YidC n=1 Tax=Hyphomonas sp. TaxID=87 RepID=UPI00180CEBC9|nr:membrane protein insertase YidC [Hyphomonas sp.]MBU3921468.1 membrane protein insertase YidC [Alphaproteobacteria bacterium]MBA3068407.1 membrane protein insertase YidC [Hyphomonas sp.]MBU4060725.1 membrane protein insertase YidC [Alphaproteobacteria bacterium]MBU4164709.1 membrane protein insertase YidC [Alphaproteobacteria bacterium]MBU4568294.1 membrane protein insertase YidC [Alphaproteobacteria bacterium]
MEKDEQRNFLLAMVAMIAFVFLYQMFVMEPAQKRYEAQQALIAAQEQTATVDTAAAEAAGPKPLPEALAASPRITIEAPSLDGSIRLAGARLDDLQLKKYFLSVDKTEEIRLLRPEETEFGYFTTYYWADGNTLVAGRNSPWTQVGEGSLGAISPVTLRLVADGVTIDRVVSVDENYLFTFSDTVTNTSGAAKTLRPIGSIEREGDWNAFLKATDPGSAVSGGLAHMGLMGVTDGTLRLQKYKPLAASKKAKGETADGNFPTTKGGWWGLTDMYWMSALVPDQASPFVASVNRASLARGGPMEVRTEGADISLAPGASVTVQNRVFAGAKQFDVLSDYEKNKGIPMLIDAIDWGWAYFLTKPFFYVLHWLHGHVGSFGWAILAFTVLVKLPLVPLYNASFKSMAKLKKLQEPMKEINERFASDPQRKQQEIMKLYKQEGANPIGGCLPILVTIPIFYALYKTLSVTIDMRHEPFWYMQDLSAPDPTAIGNLFGLLPWAAADIKGIFIIGTIFGIGLLPLLYGGTMAILQSLSPPPPDKMQARIIMAMPLVFMFVFGGFAAGLVLYWVWSNILTFIQQYTIMRLNGAETEVGKFVAGLLGRRKAAAE